MKLMTSFGCALLIGLSGTAIAATHTQIVGGGTGDCWTQFQQCVGSGWPTYKCQQLYDLCQDVNSAVPQLPGQVGERRRPH